MPSKSPGAGWRRVTCQPFRPCFFRSSRSSGWYLAIAIATVVWIAANPQEASLRGELVVHIRRRRPWRGGGWPGRPGGPSTAPPPGPRRAARSSGAGAGGRGRRRSASSRSAWTPRGRRRPVPGRTRRPRGCRPRPGTRPDAARRAGRPRPRWRRRCRRSRGAARTTARPAAACPLGLAGRGLLLLEQGEEPVGVEVLDHHRLSHRVHFEHGSIQAAGTDSPAPKTAWLSGSGEIGK